jgi:catechol-2,3-dioxygenase
LAIRNDAEYSPMAIKIENLKNMSPPKSMEFHNAKVCHVVLQVADLERATEFHTQALGFKISNVYPEAMMAGDMGFLRCNTDHLYLARVGQSDGKNAHRESHHLAFEVPILGRVLRARDRPKQFAAKIDFEGRVRAAKEWHGVISLDDAIATPVPPRTRTSPK